MKQNESLKRRIIASHEGAKFECEECEKANDSNTTSAGKYNFFTLGCKKYKSSSSNVTDIWSNFCV
jgi:hypothetical protein